MGISSHPRTEHMLSPADLADLVECDRRLGVAGSPPGQGVRIVLPTTEGTGL
jgi:hypothetical protein